MSSPGPTAPATDWGCCCTGKLCGLVAAPRFAGTALLLAKVDCMLREGNETG